MQGASASYFIVEPVYDCISLVFMLFLILYYCQLHESICTSVNIHRLHYTGNVINIVKLPPRCMLCIPTTVTLTASCIAYWLGYLSLVPIYGIKGNRDIQNPLSRGPVLWCSGLSCCLQWQASHICESVWVLVKLRRAVEDNGPSACALATHVGEPNRVSGYWLQLDLVLAVVVI